MHGRAETRSSSQTQKHRQTITTASNPAARSIRLRMSQMNRSVVGNHEIYIFPKAPTIWLTLGSPRVERAPNSGGTYLRRNTAAWSKWCLDFCQIKDKSSFLLSFWNAAPFWIDRFILGRASRCPKTQVGAACHQLGHWGYSYYTVLEIALLLKLQAYFGLQQSSMFL